MKQFGVPGRARMIVAAVLFSGCVLALNASAARSSPAACGGAAVKVGSARLCLAEGKPCPSAKFTRAWTVRGFICLAGLLHLRARVTATIPVAGGPTYITYLGGAVWVMDADAGTVTRIDPTTNKAVATIPVGEGGGQIAFGDGSLWAVSAGTDTVSRIDPATNSVIATIPTQGAYSFGLAWTPGFIWVGHHRHPPTAPSDVVKIDTASNSVVASIPVGTANFDGTGGPDFFTVASDGLWTSVTNAAALTRIDAADDTVKTFPWQPCGTSSAAFAGSLWASAGSCSNTVMRIDPRTGASTAQVSPPIGAGSGCKPAGDVNALWVLCNTLVFRIDPVTNTVADVRYVAAAGPFGGSGSLAVGAGSLWASDYAHNRVLRMTP